MMRNVKEVESKFFCPCHAIWEREKEKKEVGSWSWQLTKKITTVDMFYILDKSMQEFQCQLFSMEIHQSFTYSPIGNYL